MCWLTLLTVTFNSIFMILKKLSIYFTQIEYTTKFIIHLQDTTLRKLEEGTQHTVVWKKSPLDIFVWNLFVVKYFRLSESPMNKKHYFLFIVKNIFSFNFCRVTIATKIFSVEFSQTMVHMFSSAMASYTSCTCSYHTIDIFVLRLYY